MEKIKEFSFRPKPVPIKRLRKADLYWLSAVFLLLFAWWGYGADYFSLILFSAAYVLTVIFNHFFPKHEPQICTVIRISDGKLSLHSKTEILWLTPVEAITRVEIETSRGLSMARKALIMHTRTGDSYYLPLDGLSVDGMSEEKLVDELNGIVTEYRWSPAATG